VSKATCHVIFRLMEKIDGLPRWVCHTILSTSNRAKR
jgi:hypothetical protein